MTKNQAGPGSDSDYTYATEAGDVITIPAVSRIPAGVVRKTRNLESTDQAFTILEMIVDKESLELIDALLPAELERFLTGWQTQAGVTLGE